MDVEKEKKNWNNIKHIISPSHNHKKLILNSKLFHRHARGLIVTEQGELLLATAEKMDLDPSVKLPKSPEELEQFKEKYPDVYAVVQTV